MEIRIKNADTVTHTWGGQEFLVDQVYQVQNADYNNFLTDPELFRDVGTGNALIGDMNQFYNNPIEGWEYLEHESQEDVTTLSELVATWSEFKAFFDAMNGYPQAYFFDKGTWYRLWMTLNDQRIYVPKLEKNSADCDEFEGDYKAKFNQKEAKRVRITTCKFGRTLHDRYVPFTTADDQNFDNTDYKKRDFGDFIYTMKKRTWNEELQKFEWATTTTNSECNETWLEWDPTSAYEIYGGFLSVPSILAGNADTEWEGHVIAAPDIPEVYGGCVQLVANPSLMDFKGDRLVINADLNPKEMSVGNPNPGKIRIVVAHPVGAQSRFLFNLKVFK